MTLDEQEAESRKYSNACFIFLVLESGNIALFDNQRRLRAIDTVEGIASRSELRTYIRKPEPQTARYGFVTIPPNFTAQQLRDAGKDLDL